MNRPTPHAPPRHTLEAAPVPPSSDRRRALHLTSGIRARIASDHEVSCASQEPVWFDEVTGFQTPLATHDESGYRVRERHESGWQPVVREPSVITEAITVDRGAGMSRSTLILATLSGISIATAIIGVTLRFAGPSTIISAALLLVGAGIALFVANRNPR